MNVGRPKECVNRIDGSERGLESTRFCCRSDEVSEDTWLGERGYYSREIGRQAGGCDIHLLLAT